MQAMDVAVDVIADNAAKVDGVKISLLDKDKEIAMRRRPPQGARMYTGDDFNYAELIVGDALGHSDALLGIFDAIAPAAAAALGALTAATATPSTTSWRRPCRCPATSSRRRPGSTRPGGVHGLSQRAAGPFHHGGRAGERALDVASRGAVPLADAAGLIVDPERAVARMRIVLATRGVAA